MIETTEIKAVSSGSGGPRFKLTKRKLLVIGFLVLLVVATIVGYIFFNKPPEKQPTGKSNEELFVKQLETELPGNDDKQKAVYYLQLGAAFRDTGDKDQALANYLKADTFIKDRSATAPVSANAGIAYMYKDLGNKAKAREYFQREVSRLESNPTVAQDSAAYITSLKKLISELK